MSWRTAELSSRKRCVTVTVDADVDVSLSDVSTDDLVDELATREGAPAVAVGDNILVNRQDLEDALELAERHDWVAAQDILRGILSPKWLSREDCERAYKEARGAA